jgi:hypothetical protein
VVGWTIWLGADLAIWEKWVFFFIENLPWRVTMHIMRTSAGKQAGLWCLSVLSAAFFTFYLSLNTAACTLDGLEAMEKPISTATGQVVQRIGGSDIRYSFVANGRAFTAVGQVDDGPVERFEAGNPLIVIYDPSDPSVSVPEVSEYWMSGLQNDCGNFNRYALYVVLSCSLLGVGARVFLALKRRSFSGASGARKEATIAAELQSFAALATAASFLWISGFGSQGILEPPRNLAVGVILSLLPVLWAVLAAQGLRYGSRVGWLASIVGDIVCLGILIWCGMRGPLGLAASVALLGTPIVLLLLPRVARFYLGFNPPAA